MKTSEMINKVASEIEAELDAYPIAVPNDAIHQRIEFLANQLNGNSSYATEKAFEIFTLASDFYSVRKHQKHYGGSEAVWARMHSLIDRIRGDAINYEANGN